MKRNRFDPIAQYRENVQNVPKYPYFCLIRQLLKITDILVRFGRFLGTEQMNQINSFSSAISVIFLFCFGYPEIIGDQMRYLRNKFETKVGE